MAIVLAGGVTYLVYRQLRRDAARPRVVQIVAAAKDLPAGIELSANDLRMADWPASMPLAGSFSKASQVTGRPLIYPLGPNEPVLERDLAVEGSGFGLSVKIPPGMRATSVRSNAIVGVAGFLYPGSRVDVLGTFTIPGNPNPVTETILQNVGVLTAGEKIEPDPQGKPQTVNVVTLLLTPEDSQKLLLVSTQGSIQFVLRNGADKGKTDLPPTRLDQLVAENKSTASISKPSKPRAAALKPADDYQLEVIEGDKRSVEKF
ncbi:MAG: Flp pilus assembly protein CpaB [Terriglobia bacterium]